MNDLFITESSLEDSFIYKSFNASNSLVERLVKYIKNSTKLDKSFFEEQYLQMRKLNISPLSRNVVDAFDNGDVEILYARDEKVTQSLPFIVRKNTEGRIVASIFISMYATIDKSDNLVIPVKKLYALMESAYIALEMQKQPMKVQRNVGLMKLMMVIYSSLIMRVINKEYQLALDRPLYDKATYVISRFFLERVWGYPNPDMVESYARSELKFVEDADLSMVSVGYKALDIKSFDDMIKYLKTLSPRMEELNTRYFIERYVNTYHAASILSLDYLPYVFFVVVNVLIGSFLIAQPALSDVIKNTKGINKFYAELSKIL